MGAVEQLSGFGFRGFRSFHGDLEVLAPLSKVNLVAGQNNSGKSNVLRVADQLRRLQNTAPEQLDVPRTPSPPLFKLAIRMGDREAVLDTFCARNNVVQNGIIDAIRKTLSHPAVNIANDGGVWLCK